MVVVDLGDKGCLPSSCVVVVDLCGKGCQATVWWLLTLVIKAAKQLCDGCYVKQLCGGG